MGGSEADSPDYPLDKISLIEAGKMRFINEEAAA